MIRLWFGFNLLLMSMFLTACNSSRLDKKLEPTIVVSAPAEEKRGDHTVTGSLIQDRKLLSQKEAFLLLSDDQQPFAAKIKNLGHSVTNYFDFASFWRELPHQSFYSQLSVADKSELAGLSLLTCGRESSNSFITWALAEKQISYLYELDQKCHLYLAKGQVQPFIDVLKKSPSKQLIWGLQVLSRSAQGDSREAVKVHLSGLAETFNKKASEVFSIISADQLELLYPLLSDLHPQASVLLADYINRNNRMSLLLEAWGYERVVAWVLQQTVQLTAENAQVLKIYVQERLGDKDLHLAASYYQFLWFRSVLKNQKSISLDLKLDLIESLLQKVFYSRSEAEISALPDSSEKEWMNYLFSGKADFEKAKRIVFDEYEALTLGRLRYALYVEDDSVRNEYCDQLKAFRKVMASDSLRGCFKSEEFLKLTAKMSTLESPWDQVILTEGANLKLVQSKIKLSFVDLRGPVTAIKLESIPVAIGLRMSDSSAATFIFQVMKDSGKLFKKRDPIPGASAGRLYLNDAQSSIIKAVSSGRWAEPSVHKRTGKLKYSKAVLMQEFNRLQFVENGQRLRNSLRFDVTLPFVQELLLKNSGEHQPKILVALPLSFDLQPGSQEFFESVCPNLNKECLELSVYPEILKQLRVALDLEDIRRFSLDTDEFIWTKQVAPAGQRGGIYETR